jgi:hypothetical protein
MHCSKPAVHSITSSLTQQRVTRNFEVERSRRFQIDRKLVFGGLLDRKIGGFLLQFFRKGLADCGHVIDERDESNCAAVSHWAATPNLMILASPTTKMSSMTIIQQRNSS